MTKLFIKHLTSGGVITNYHCVSRCGHCLYNCGPHRKRNYLEGNRAETIFGRIVALGCRSVHIGGGEPLLQVDQLIPVLEAARNKGVVIEYVETNSAWFKDAGQAMDMLHQLLAAGVGTLLISISPFHNAYIPFKRVKGVINACRQVGMQAFPWVNAFVRDLSRLDQNRPHALAEFSAAFGTDYLERIPDRYWIHLGGRALATFRGVYPEHPVDHILNSSPANCARALADTTHFHIDLHGNYIPGLCSGLAIDMKDLGRPIDSDKYPLLSRLATTGIQGLYALASQDLGYIPQRDAYLNHCDLCTDIRFFLSHSRAGLFPELAPEGFYIEHP